MNKVPNTLSDKWSFIQSIANENITGFRITDIDYEVSGLVRFTAVYHVGKDLSYELGIAQVRLSESEEKLERIRELLRSYSEGEGE